MVTTLRLVMIAAAMAYIYSAVKVSVPLLNHARYDVALWNLDRALFLGASPDVFLINLFPNPWLLRGIDFLYGNLFFAFMFISQPLIVTLASDSVRLGWAAGNVAMCRCWGRGAIAVPSLGPAFAFHR